jgi:hypothetical protein
MARADTEEKVKVLWSNTASIISLNCARVSLEPNSCSTTETRIAICSSVSAWRLVVKLGVHLIRTVPWKAGWPTTTVREGPSTLVGRGPVID